MVDKLPRMMANKLLVVNLLENGNYKMCLKNDLLIELPCPSALPLVRVRVQLKWI